MVRHRGDAYLPQPEFESAVDAAIVRGGERVAREVIGRSVRGRDLVAARVAAAGRRPDQTRPATLVFAAMHGMEVIASELGLAVLEDAVDRPDDPFVAALLALTDLVVVPVLNPDGRADAVDSLRGARIWNRCRRTNANRVDLNRNFPPARDARTSWLPIAGTDIAGLPWYRGPRPLSEPESSAIAELGRRIRPVGMLNLHSTGRLLVYPWSSRGEPSPDADGYEAVTSAFRRAQPYARYRPKQSHAWYPTTGESDEWFYDEIGTLAVTVELTPLLGAVRHDWRRARWLFWWANPADPRPEVDATRAACFAALTEAARWHATGRLQLSPAT